VPWGFHFQAIIESDQECTQRLGMTQLEDTHLDHYQGILVEFWELLLWRLSIGGILGAEVCNVMRHTWRGACQVMTLYAIVSQLAAGGMWPGDLTFELWWRDGWWQSICMEACGKQKLYLKVGLWSFENEEMIVNLLWIMKMVSTHDDHMEW